ncbi:MAG: endolytic transglycosylase MltG [Bacilli bacterium]
MKKFNNAAKILIILSAILIIGCCSIYKYKIDSVSNNSDKVEIIVESGSSYLTITSLLKENNLIKSEFFYKLYIKLFKINGLQAGKYSLSEDMGVAKIVETLKNGSTYNPDTITITFKEGINIREIANLIEDNTNNTKDEVFELLEDENYIDELISKYWFLTDEIKNKDIYYSLEGYLFPNTYEFSKTTKIETIIETMLDQMKVELDTYKITIEESNYTVHEILTLASVIELEAGNSNDRSGVAGVFYNRLENNWALGSDVTTYYGSKIDDFSYSLTYTELNDCSNKYNTRCSTNKGLPVGPIDNPGKESIDATINPTSNNYYYFVADCSGKTYFNTNSSGHTNTIQELISADNWCA